MKKYNKYMKRWNMLSEDQKILYFDTYMMGKDMCGICISTGTRQAFPTTCIQCTIMFGKEVGPYDLRINCPCTLFKRDFIKDHPPSVIEYCLIQDGFIEAEE